MEHKDYRLAAVMFTDIVGFSRMMEDDEKGTLKTLDFHDKLVREQVARFRGSVIKTIGDAFLAQFNTTLDAVECSLAVQNGIREYNEAALGKPLTLRIGVHLGDIYFYENDALGEGINIASRLQSVTKPGHITISREVYSQVSGKIAMRVESMGQVHLKNITREVYGYEIIPGGADNNSTAARRALQPEVDETPPETPHSERQDREPSTPPPPFRDLRDEWRSLRSQIKDQVKSELHGRPERWRDVRHEVKQQFRQAHWQGAPDGLKTPDGPPATTFEIYRQKKIRESQNASGGFRGHFIPFVAVNAFLFYLYNTQTPGGYPWFLYPLMGWGIGIVSHWVSVRAAQKSAREVRQIESADDEETATIRKYQDSRAGFYGHFGSNLMVSALLAMIWFINTPHGFAWPLIPIAGMAIGVFSHWNGYLSRRSAFKDFWRGRKATIKGKKPSPKVEVVNTDPLLAKAQTLRDSIVARAGGIRGGNPFGDDMTLTLDNYVKQIGELSSIERELGRVVSSFQPSELEAEEVVLRKKVETTASATLRAEYEKSLTELGHQRKSFGDLAEQQEILGLRLKSAMGNLQQMQVDLARIKGLSDGNKDSTFVAIKERSEELSRYIDDYREGLKEIPE